MQLVRTCRKCREIYLANYCCIELNVSSVIENLGHKYSDLSRDMETKERVIEITCEKTICLSLRILLLYCVEWIENHCVGNAWKYTRNIVGEIVAHSYTVNLLT